MNNIHLVYWYKNKVLYFRTSDGREGSEPATLKTYKNVKDRLCDSLGLNVGDTAEDITQPPEPKTHSTKGSILNTIKPACYEVRSIEEPDRLPTYWTFPFGGNTYIVQPCYTREQVLKLLETKDDL